MANNYFSFKQFTINQGKSAFKVGTDGVLLGACASVSGRKKVLDIGTGTGLIALMIAQRSNADIVAIEPENDSFIQACDNISESKWAGRIKVVKSYLQEFQPDGDRFDLIVTNPPYFIDSMKNPDPLKSASRHDVYLNHRDLLEGTNRLLADNGMLQLILPYAEGNIFIAEAQEYNLYCCRILKIRPTPSSAIRRMILGFTREKKKPDEQFLTIEKGKRHQFTEEYIELVKDFYLNF